MDLRSIKTSNDVLANKGLITCPYKLGMMPKLSAINGLAVSLVIHWPHGICVFKKEEEEEEIQYVHTASKGL